MLNLQETQFILSAAAPEGLIRDGLPQIAFAGRSNVGKSSVLNRLCGRRSLARTSGTPGKTAHVNYFAIPGDDKDKTAAYLVDLPGYGYARVGDEEKKRWATLMEAYFTENTAIRLVVAVVDVRHEPTAQDIQMRGTCAALGLPALILANKADKLKKSRLPEAAAAICRALDIPPEELVLFSSIDGTGREELLYRIAKALS